MTKKQLLAMVKAGEAFVDIEYDGDWVLIHDVCDDKYYIINYSGKRDRVIEVTMHTEVRYNDDCMPDELDLVCGTIPGYNIPDADYSGEFDEPLETSGLYVWRYGYFSKISDKNPDKVTRLIELWR